MRTTQLLVFIMICYLQVLNCFWKYPHTDYSPQVKLHLSWLATHRSLFFIQRMTPVWSLCTLRWIKRLRQKMGFERQHLYCLYWGENVPSVAVGEKTFISSLLARQHSYRPAPAFFLKRITSYCWGLVTSKYPKKTLFPMPPSTKHFL